MENRSTAIDDDNNSDWRRHERLEKPSLLSSYNINHHEEECPSTLANEVDFDENFQPVDGEK